MILDSDYPSKDHLYGDVFVHTRVKEYVKYSNVQVVSFFRNWENYEYEGIDVKHAPEMKDIKNIYDEFCPDALFIHFYDRRLFSFVKSVNVPVVIWVHGYEALGWYRRLFNYTPYQFLRQIHHTLYYNTSQMLGFRKLVKISNAKRNIKFVFVSDWMRKVAQFDCFTKVRNYSIIPNPININLFKYKEKSADDRKQILLIRSFASNKYANDIAFNAIQILSSKPFFDQLHFTIYGKGKYFKSLTDSVKPFANVEIYEEFIANQEIPDIHAKYGIFLCPTRQDAQGVSMCEAMSSGLVSVTSNNTAIPEFVEHQKTGMLSDNARQLADSIERLYNEPELFLRLSRNASLFIREKCAIKNTIRKELEIINLDVD